MIEKKTILIINGAQFGYSAGHYYYCKYLRDTYHIEYVCYDRNQKKLEIEGVKVNYVSFKGNKFLRTLRFLGKSILICNSLSPSYLYLVYFRYCFLLAILGNAKQKILDIRSGSLVINKHVRTIDNFWLRFLSLFFNKRVILSEGLRYQLKIKSKNTLILPLGAEVYFDGLHNFNSLHLLYVGLLDRRNIFETVEGLSIFVKKNPEIKIKYTIIGGGDSIVLGKLKSAIERTNLNDIIFIEGMKNYEDFPEYFSTANIGVAYVPMVDYYQNQQVTKLFEYMLSGMAVIATNTNENRLLIRSNNGVLCNDCPDSFAKALGILIRNTYDSEDIRNSMMKYHWKNLVDEILKPFLDTE